MAGEYVNIGFHWLHTIKEPFEKSLVLITGDGVMVAACSKPMDRVSEFGIVHTPILYRRYAVCGSTALPFLRV